MFSSPPLIIQPTLHFYYIITLWVRGLVLLCPHTTQVPFFRFLVGALFVFLAIAHSLGSRGVCRARRLSIRKSGMDCHGVYLLTTPFHSRGRLSLSNRVYVGIWRMMFGLRVVPCWWLVLYPQGCVCMDGDLVRFGEA